MSDLRPPVVATRRVPVWDLPVRLFHWTLALLFAVLWISGDSGKLGLHITTGALMLTLVLFRIVWGVAGSSTARFSSFLTGPGRVIGYLRNPSTWNGLGHNPLGGWSVTLLLSLLLLQSALGLFTTDDIATDGPLVWTVSSATVKTLSSLHRLGSWVLLGLVALHVSAIAYYRWGKNHDLVTPMIGGDADLAPDAAAQAEAGVRAPSQKALGILIVVGAVVYGGLAIWGR
jgi:cytochrome b